MKALTETPTKQQVSFWLNAVLSQFGKEVKELTRKGTEEYSQTVVDHFVNTLDVWQQARKVFEQEDYPRALDVVQVA
jgi:hypothetical protein